MTALARFADSNRLSNTSSATCGIDALFVDGWTSIRYLDPPTDDRLNWMGKFKAELLFESLSNRRFLRRRSLKRRMDPAEASFSDGLLAGPLPRPSPHSGDRSGDDEHESNDDRLTASSFASSSSSSSSSDESANVVELLSVC